MTHEQAIEIIKRYLQENPAVMTVTTHDVRRIVNSSFPDREYSRILRMLAEEDGWIKPQNPGLSRVSKYLVIRNRQRTLFEDEHPSCTGGCPSCCGTVKQIKSIMR